MERFALPELPFEYTPNYNIAPTQLVFAVLPGEDFQARKPALLRWGLTPSWQKPGSKPLINARLETLAQKPSFRPLVNSHRCLIIADGFYEWKTENGGKFPVYITLDGGRPFAFAGLWQEGEVPSCTIITQEAASFLQPVHDRMPVILTPKTEGLWLSSLPFVELVRELPNQEGRPFAYHRVSRLVNSPRHNSPECILPAAN